MSIASVNPATGEVLREFEPLDDRALEARLADADAAFHLHRRTSLRERAEWMHEAARILEADKERFGRVMTLEMGKPLRAAVAEAEKCAWVCRFYADHAAEFMADEEVPTDARRSLVRYQPLGPVLAVMPWNFPFWQVFRFAAPALMAGNVGLLKHASNVPQCALAIEEIFRRAGFGEGVFQALLIGSDRVATLIDDPRVRAVTLTGSTPAGSAVAERAGKRIKKTVLELGGSDPFVVMPSADLQEAVRVAVTARTLNNGQSCIAAKRFIVHQAVYDEFQRRFVERMRALRVGDPLAPETDIGPLATPEIREGVHEQVRRSVEQGARLLTGGELPEGPGNFYPPTVLAEIPPDSPAYTEEIFGPVASLFRVADLEEAVRVANDTVFGLGSAAWTQDPEEQSALIDGLEAGQVFINGMVSSDPRLPFGGVKQSGYGRELGAVGLREFVNVKTVWIGEGGQRGPSEGSGAAEASPPRSGQRPTDPSGGWRSLGYRRRGAETSQGATPLLPQSPDQIMPKLQPETLPRPVFLIDADGSHRGVVPVEVARELAAERGMDLVEIAPLANPPGVRIMARSAYRYEDPDTRK